MQRRTRRTARWLAIFLSVTLYAGCARWVGEAPSIEVLPTLTASPQYRSQSDLYASPTPAIRTPTARPVTPTIAPSATPTLPAATALLGPSSTPSGPTLQPGMPTALPTIDYFVASPTEVMADEPVLLFWSSAEGDEVLVYRLDEEGDPGTTWEVDVEGSLDVEPEGKLETETYVLAVTNALGTTEARVSVAVSDECAEPWFFVPPLEDSCPDSPATESLASSQRFERGQMIWISGAGQIVVLFDADPELGQLWLREAPPAEDPAALEPYQPPEGLLRPDRGFGALWAASDAVRDGLGWATGPEQGFSTTYQIAEGEAGDSFFFINISSDVQAGEVEATPATDGLAERQVVGLLADEGVWRVVGLAP